MRGDTRETPARARDLVAFFLALLVATLYPRGFLLVDHAGALAVGDGKGIAADVAAAAFAGAVLVAICGWSRSVAALLAVLWVAIQFVNHETVRFLGALASVSDAAFLVDPTFVQGSALAVSRPVSLAVLSLAAAVTAWRAAPPSVRAVAALGAVGGFALIVYALVPWTDQLATWRQSNVAVWNVARLARSGLAEGAASGGDAHEALLAAVPGLAADLSGTPRVPLASASNGRPPNVLLLVLESLSGGFLDSAASAHGQRASASMPGLDAVARRNLHFTSFVTHQRKTNRGLYAILCGDLPALAGGEPQMSAYPEAGGRVCLPEILRRAGYRTVYHQAAPLAFMLKDRFMARVGFERVNGHEFFEPAYARSAWGIDDRGFFEQSLALVDELQHAGEPWFLTMLTVGTHHPFIVPDDWQPDVRDARARAFSYLDAAFLAFYAALDERGVFDDTLLLITSDESFGSTGVFDDPLEKVLSQSWGVLIAQTPREGPRQDDAGRAVAEPYGLLDVAISILDYVGLGGRGAHLLGRSAFRSYDTPRWLFFGNANLRAMGAFDPGGAVLVCLDDYRSCRRFQVPAGRLFGADRAPLAWESADEQRLRDVARHTRARSPAAAGSRTLELVASPHFAVDGPGTQVVFGGQFIELGAGEWVESDIALDVRGAPGSLQVTHFLRPEHEKSLVRIQDRMHGGQTLELRYTYRTDVAVRGLSSQVLVRILEGEHFDLDVTRARLSIHAGGTGSPPPGLKTEFARVVPTGRQAARRPESR